MSVPFCTPSQTMPDAQVVFREMADEHPDADAGDVVFVLKQKEPCQ